MTGVYVHIIMNQFFNKKRGQHKKYVEWRIWE